MSGLNHPLFRRRPNQLFDDFGTERTLHLELLMYRRQWRIVERSARNVIEAGDGAVLRDLVSGAGQRTNRGTCREIVKGNEPSKTRTPS